MKFNFLVLISLLFLISCNGSDSNTDPDPSNSNSRTYYESRDRQCVPQPPDGIYRVLAVKGSKAYNFTCFGRDIREIPVPTINSTSIGEETTIDGKRYKIKETPVLFERDRKPVSGVFIVTDQEANGYIHEFRNEKVTVENGRIIKIGSDVVEDFIYMGQFTRSGRTLEGLDRTYTYRIMQSSYARFSTTKSIIYVTCVEHPTDQLIGLTVTY